MFSAPGLPAKATVLGGGFFVVAGLAQRLPVGFVPKNRHITPVRGDVVHHRSPDNQPARVACRAKWPVAQERGPRLLPFVAIAALGGSATPLVTVCAMARQAIRAPPGWMGCGVRAGRRSARTRRSNGHGAFQ